MPHTANGRTADNDIDPIFLHRWSPRAFTGEAMPQAVLLSLFEAARWAPSALNLQPWRFVYAHRGSPQWGPLFDALLAFNQAWVKDASVLIYVVSDRFRRRADAEPAPNVSHSFDAGAAWAYLALQAQHLGWAAHGMGGFDRAKAYEALGVSPTDYQVEAAVAVGRIGDKAILSEALQAREVPSDRQPVSSLVFEGRLTP